MYLQRLRCQRCLDLVERLLSTWRSLEGYYLPTQIIQRSGDCLEMRDELSEILRCADLGLEGLLVFRCRSGAYRCYFFRVNRDAASVYNVAQVLDLLFEELTFLSTQPNTRNSPTLKTQAQVRYMLVAIGFSDDRVVQVLLRSRNPGQHLLDDCLEDCMRAGQTERQTVHSKKPRVRRVYHVATRLLVEFELQVGIGEVELREVLSSRKRLEHLVARRHRNCWTLRCGFMET
jgi:hypothetical protein